MVKKNQTVTFLFENEYTLNNISRNISHFFYNKNEIKVDEYKKADIKKIIKKSDYVFVDHDSLYLKKINTKKTKVIYIPDHIYAFEKKGLNKLDLSNKEIMKLTKRYENISFAVSSSEAQTVQLMSDFNLNEKQIIKLGSPIIDALQGNKVIVEIDNLMFRYPDTIFQNVILFVPNPLETIEDNIIYINQINKLATINSNIKIYYYLDNKILKKFKDVTINAILIDQEDINTFVHIASYIISNNSKYLAIAIYLKRNVVYLENDTINNIEIELYCSSDMETINQIIENQRDLNSEVVITDERFIPYYNQAISRKVVDFLFKGNHE